ncbi:hypothetical protein BDW75DRAFT_45305 [Aspergillus navahoensis]
MKSSSSCTLSRDALASTGRSGSLRPALRSWGLGRAIGCLLRWLTLAAAEATRGIGLLRRLDPACRWHQVHPDCLSAEESGGSQPSSDTPPAPASA